MNLQLQLQNSVLTEFIETIQQVNKKYGPFDAAIGHSFGGMALLNSVASGLNINKLVTIGADNSIPQIFKYFVNKIGLKPVIAQNLELFFEKNTKQKLIVIPLKKRQEKYLFLH